ncbi:MAG: alpha/beta hydrolase [Sedimentisphaerales bacterium]|nr:alpha/beta hydrolase [Sedimentisphaerales bacterium]
MSKGKQNADSHRTGLLLRMIRFIGILYLGMIMFAWGCADRMIFHPPPAGYVDGPEVIKIETPGGQRISAVHRTSPEAKFTVLISHGNAEDIGYGRESIEMFVEHGYNVLAYDYRGYGTSDGRPSERNTYEDIEAAYQYLLSRANVPAGRIIVLGRSVGSGPATYLAGRNPVGALLLEAPFVSAFRVVTSVPLLPFDKFNNLARIDKVACPVLIVHGRADEVVAFWHGQKLFARANEPKLHLWVDGAGHNDLYVVAGEDYWQALLRLTLEMEKDTVEEVE